MEINSYLLHEAVPFTQGASGDIATAAASVDIVSHGTVTATAAGLTLTLPAPADARDGLEFLVSNIGTNPFDMYGLTVDPGDHAQFIWANSAWHRPKAIADETVTTMGPAVVDAITDPNNVTVTIPYANEDASNPAVTFAVPIPAPVSVVNSIDLKPTANPNELTVEIVYTDDAGSTVTITDTTPVDLSALKSSVTYSSTAGAPAATGRIDNDTHFVTDDGTPAGVVTEQWVFDEETTTWTQVPVPVVCPAPMTRTQLNAQRNAGNLRQDCHYVITDYSRGTVGAATILLHAVDATTLGQSAEVKTTFDNTAWVGRYDIDTNRILELNDNLGNKVTGQEIVDTFPWGNSAVYDNIVEEGATFTYTSGNFFDNVLRTGAVVIADSTAGNFARNVIGEDSNVTWNAGDFRDNIILTDAVVNLNSTGDFDNNEVNSFASVTVTGSASADQNTFGQNASFTTAAGSFTNNQVHTDAAVNMLGGNWYENDFGTGSVVNATTTRNFHQNKVSRSSAVTLGDCNVYQCNLDRVSINMTGSSGSGVRHCQFVDCTTQLNMTNVTALDWAYVKVQNNSVVTIPGASRCYLRNVTLENFGRILQSAGTLLDSNSTGMRDYAYIQVLNGRLYVNNTTASGVSYVQHNTSGANRVDSMDVSARGNIRFLGTSNNCRVYYGSVTSGGNIYTTGAATGCYFYYNDVASSSQMFADGSVNLRAYYNTLSGNSQYYSRAVTGTHYAYYNALAGHGYLRHQNSAGGRFYGLHIGGQALVQLDSGTDASRIYYSSFAAYYYLYVNAISLPATRTALHGYGRRTYSPTAAVPNGTFTQNF